MCSLFLPPQEGAGLMALMLWLELVILIMMVWQDVALVRKHVAL
jgi:hypothetical protein